MLAVSLADELKALRLRAGLTQETLSAATGGEVSASMIAHIETGRRLPAPDSLGLLGAALGASAKERKRLEALRREEKDEALSPTEAVIMRDPHLSPSAKRGLVAAYRAARNEYARPSGGAGAASK